MKTLYRTSFRLKPTLAPSQLVDQLAAECFRWVFDPKKRSGLDKSIQRPTTAETIQRRQIGQARELESLNASYGDQTAWGMRFCETDSADTELRWITDLGFYAPDQTQADFTCSLSVSRTASAYAPVYRPASRPRIVTSILHRFGGSGGFPLLCKPIVIKATEKNVELFTNVLLAKERTHPILFISPDQDTKQPLVTPSVLADRLAGLAHVVVAEEAEVTWMLKKRLPDHLNCWAGAVRLYWPGFKLSDVGYIHPLWLVREWHEVGNEATERLAQQVLNTIAEVTVYNLHPRLLTWDRLQDLDRQNAIREAKASGKSDELLGLFEVENRRLSEQTRQLEVELAEKTLKLSEESRRRETELAETAETAKRQEYLVEFYRAELEKRKNDTSTSAEASRLPATTIQEAIAFAEKDHVDRLVFAWNNKSEQKHSQFEQAVEVESAFKWLATTYWLSRTGKTPCPSLDVSLRETIPGWTYSGGQSEITVGQYKSWYRCNWDGRSYDIMEHLRCGSGFDPRTAVRIAFAWDAARQKVVIGFLGQHQRNTQS